MTCKMVLAQFIITLDDILNNANETPNGYTITPITSSQTSWNNPATVVRQVNLYGGRYRVKVDNMTIYSGATNVTTYYFNPQIININSSKFHFPGGGSPGLNFSNNNASVQGGIAGHREFEMNDLNGTIDLSISISQYGQSVNANPAAVVAPFTIDKTATWASAQFSYILLTLEFTVMDSKALFGNANQAFLQ